MTRRGKIVGAGAALLLVLVIGLGWRGGNLLSVTESTERASYYFRLKASYTHDNQPIDFDIVVACGIRIDRYKGGDSGYLATRYPRFFVKETHDGHTVMQIVPIACRGETTADGRVPGDFLPGVIWFDKPGDYRFGIGYVSEDAFENLNSQLKFDGASIEKATHEDWTAFRKRAADNEGMRRRYYDGPFYGPEDGKLIATGAGKEVEAAYARGCVGVLRFKLSEAGQEIAREFWPAAKPKYWATQTRKSSAFKGLLRVEREIEVFADGLGYVKHLNGGNYEYGGFPTRAHGGMIGSRSNPKAPPEIFPIRDDRGVPWVFTDEVATSQYLTKQVELVPAGKKGFLYCYTVLGNNKDRLGIPVPDFRMRESRVRINGEWVETLDSRRSSWPSRYFERDEYLYVEFNIGLS